MNDVNVARAISWFVVRLISRHDLHVRQSLRSMRFPRGRRYACVRRGRRKSSNKTIITCETRRDETGRDERRGEETARGLTVDDTLLLSASQKRKGKEREGRVQEEKEKNETKVYNRADSLAEQSEEKKKKKRNNLTIWYNYRAAFVFVSSFVNATIQLKRRRWQDWYKRWRSMSSVSH